VESLLVLGLVFGGCIALWLYTRPKRKARDVAGLRRELAHLTHDEAAAQRLVEAEQARSPDATERELLEKVIRRLRYERRR
jgi:hypothetical protein